MMRLTDAAADRIKSVMANAGRPIVGVRVGVKNGGCAGMAYTMEYAEKVEPSEPGLRPDLSHPACATLTAVLQAIAPLVGRRAEDR
jgi:hypothetical protein